MPYSPVFSSPWEDCFTVAQWDQRGVGKEREVPPGYSWGSSIGVEVAARRAE